MCLFDVLKIIGDIFRDVFPWTPDWISVFTQAVCVRTVKKSHDVSFPHPDGKSSSMAMAASNACGDITDMDCSPAELEELIKEVWLPLTLNHITNRVSFPSLCLSVLCQRSLDVLLQPLSQCVFFSPPLYRTAASPLTHSHLIFITALCLVNHSLSFFFFWFV